MIHTIEVDGAAVRYGLDNRGGFVIIDDDARVSVDFDANSLYTIEAAKDEAAAREIARLAIRSARKMSKAASTEQVAAHYKRCCKKLGDAPELGEQLQKSPRFAEEIQAVYSCASGDGSVLEVRGALHGTGAVLIKANQYCSPTGRAVLMGGAGVVLSRKDAIALRALLDEVLSAEG